MGCCGGFGKNMTTDFIIELLALIDDDNNSTCFSIKEIKKVVCQKMLEKTLLEIIEESKLLNNDYIQSNFTFNINNTLFYFYTEENPMVKNYLQAKDVEPINFEHLWKISILIITDYDKLKLPKISLINKTKFCPILKEKKFNFKNELMNSKKALDPNITQDELSLSKQILTKEPTVGDIDNNELIDGDDNKDIENDDEDNGEEDKIFSEDNEENSEEKNETKLKNYIHIKGDITMETFNEVKEKLSINDDFNENMFISKQSQSRLDMDDEGIVRNNSRKGSRRRSSRIGNNNDKQSEGFESSKESFYSNKDNENNDDKKDENKNKIISVYMSDIKVDDIEMFNNLIELLIHYPFLKKFALIDLQIDKDSEIWGIVLKLFNENENIRWIDLHKSNMNNNVLDSICKTLEYKRIRYLDVSENFINKEGAKYLSEFLSDNTTLQRLIVNNNDLEDFKNIGVNCICQSLINHPNIQFLDFSSMSVTGCGQKISEVIKNTKTLKNLILRDCTLNLKDFQFICRELCNENVSKTIINVDLSYNDMASDKSLEEMANVIKKNKSITFLYMDKMNLDMKNYNIILDALKVNNIIVNFSFCFNPKVKPKILLDYFYERNELNSLAYIPYKSIVNESDKKVEFTLEERKIIERFKKKRKKVKLVYK